MKKKTSTNCKKKKFIFILLFCIMSMVSTHTFAQNTQADYVNITGTVVDNRGESLVGANVVQKETTNGTISDADGKFELRVPIGSTIQISYIGCVPIEIKANRSENIQIALTEDSKMMDEVVIVGYGIQKKANLSGSVASVNFKDLADMPVANTASMLQGRLPGVVLTASGAQPGNDNPQIRIRGIGTLSDHNDPMILIDGVESNMGQLSQLPPNDIENISVLKDAASASIYGVRAANGVILVTTKRGGEQQLQISYSGSVVLQTATVKPNYVNSADWAKLYNTSRGVDFYTTEMITKLENGSDPDNFANTDWFSEMFRTAPMHQHHLSFNGGSKDVHYMVSLQYMDQEGILRSTGMQKYNFRSNIDAKLGRVKLGLNLAGGRQKIDEPAGNITGDNGVMRYLTWFTRPTVPAKYSNGHFGYVDGTSISHTVFKNPLQTMHDGWKDNNKYNIDAQVFGELDIIDALKFRSSLAYNYFNHKTASFYPRSKVYNAEGNVLSESKMNSMSKYDYISTKYINENIFTYSKQLGKHGLNLLAGHSIQSQRIETDRYSIQNFPSDNLGSIGAGSENPSVDGDVYENSLQSYFGRINYNYDDRYLAEMNIRRDGSSKMPKKNRYATFPSFSVAWIISNEQFMKPIKPIHSLKLRGSWGKLGNQEIGDYAYTSTFATGADYYFEGNKQIGLHSARIANDNIKWETTTITDIGVDFSILKGKVSTTFDWFNKETTDILLRLNMPSSFLGILSPPYQNAGEVRNRGWEWSTNYSDSKGDFSWQAGFNLSAVKNKIVDNKEIDSFGSNTINREGNPINSFYGLRAIGIYRTAEDLSRTTLVDGQEVQIMQFGQTPKLGDIMYADVSKDGNINQEDREILGNPFPKLEYGFNLGFSWKDLDMSMFWQGVGGINRYNWESSTISNGGNLTDRWLNHYSAENINGSMPRLGNAYNDEYSSFWLTKANYLRLKNIELGYTFNRKSLSKFGIKSARIYVAASNLITFTSLDNYDPEKTNSDMRNDVYPNAKTYSFGLNLNF